MVKLNKERVSGIIEVEFTMEWVPEDYGKKPTKKQMLKEVEKEFKDIKNYGSFYYPKFKLKVKK